MRNSQKFIQYNEYDLFVLQAAYSIKKYLANKSDMVRPKPDLETLKI